MHMVQEGDHTHYNMLVENCTVNRCWRDVIAQARFEERREAAKEFNK